MSDDAAGIGFTQNAREAGHAEIFGANFVPTRETRAATTRESPAGVRERTRERKWICPCGCGAYTWRPEEGEPPPVSPPDTRDYRAMWGELRSAVGRIEALARQEGHDHAAGAAHVVLVRMDLIERDHAADRAGACDHCWHGTGVGLLGYPPTYPQKCCWCGETRHYRPNPDAGRHGPHAPKGPA
jgi:hypothetical protein